MSSKRYSFLITLFLIPQYGCQNEEPQQSLRPPSCNRIEGLNLINPFSTNKALLRFVFYNEFTLIFLIIIVRNHDIVVIH